MLSLCKDNSVRDSPLFPLVPGGPLGPRGPRGPGRPGRPGGPMPGVPLGPEVPCVPQGPRGPGGPLRPTNQKKGQDKRLPHPTTKDLDCFEEVLIPFISLNEDCLSYTVECLWSFLIHPIQSLLSKKEVMTR